MANKTYSMRISATDDFSGTLKRLRTESQSAFNAVERGSRGATGGLRRFAGNGLSGLTAALPGASGGLGSLGAGLGAIAGPAGLAVGAGVAIAGVASELGKLGAESTAAKNVFNLLASEFGNADRVLQQLNAVTGGVTDNITLMSSANKLMASGLAESAEELAEFQRLGVQLGAAFGEDAATAMENFNLAILNMSYQRLDTFGISASRVRARVKELKDEFGTETAFKMAVFEEGSKSLDRFGAAIQKNFTPVDKLNKKLSDLGASIGEGINAWWQDLIARTLDIINLFEDVHELIQLRISAINPFDPNRSTILEDIETIESRLGTVLSAGGAYEENWSHLSDGSVATGIREVADTVVELDTALGETDEEAETLRRSLEALFAVGTGEEWGAFNQLKVLALAALEAKGATDEVIAATERAFNMFSGTTSPAYESVMENIGPLLADVAETDPGRAAELAEYFLEQFETRSNEFGNTDRGVDALRLAGLDIGLFVGSGGGRTIDVKPGDDAGILAAREGISYEQAKSLYNEQGILSIGQHQLGGIGQTTRLTIGGEQWGDAALDPLHGFEGLPTIDLPPTATLSDFIDIKPEDLEARAQTLWDQYHASLEEAFRSGDTELLKRLTGGGPGPTIGDVAPTVTIDADTTLADEKIAAVKGAVDELTAEPKTVDIRVDVQPPWGMHRGRPEAPADGGTGPLPDDGFTPGFDSEGGLVQVDADNPAVIPDITVGVVLEKGSTWDTDVETLQAAVSGITADLMAGLIQADDWATDVETIQGAIEALTVDVPLTIDTIDAQTDLTAAIDNLDTSLATPPTVTVDVGINAADAQSELTNAIDSLFADDTVATPAILVSPEIDTATAQSDIITAMDTLFAEGTASPTFAVTPIVDATAAQSLITQAMDSLFTDDSANAPTFAIAPVIVSDAQSDIITAMSQLFTDDSTASPTFAVAPVIVSDAQSLITQAVDQLFTDDTTAMPTFTVAPVIVSDAQSLITQAVDQLFTDDTTAMPTFTVAPVIVSDAQSLVTQAMDTLFTDDSANAPTFAIAPVIVSDAQSDIITAMSQLFTDDSTASPTFAVAPVIVSDAQSLITQAVDQLFTDDTTAMPTFTVAPVIVSDAQSLVTQAMDTLFTDDSANAPTFAIAPVIVSDAQSDIITAMDSLFVDGSTASPTFAVAPVIVSDAQSLITNAMDQLFADDSARMPTFMIAPVISTNAQSDIITAMSQLFTDDSTASPTFTVSPVIDTADAQSKLTAEVDNIFDAEGAIPPTFAAMVSVAASETFAEDTQTITDTLNALTGTAKVGAVAREQWPTDVESIQSAIGSITGTAKVGVAKGAEWDAEVQTITDALDAIANERIAKFKVGVVENFAETVTGLTNWLDSIAVDRTATIDVEVNLQSGGQGASGAETAPEGGGGLGLVGDLLGLLPGGAMLADSIIGLIGGGDEAAAGGENPMFAGVYGGSTLETSLTTLETDLQSVVTEQQNVQTEVANINALDVTLDTSAIDTALDTLEERLKELTDKTWTVNMKANVSTSANAANVVSTDIRRFITDSERGGFVADV